MKLCQECKHCEQVGKYKRCKREPEESPICLNERSEEGKCGPDAKFWEKK